MIDAITTRLREYINGVFVIYLKTAVPMRLYSRGYSRVMLLLPSIANSNNTADIISVTLRQKPSPYVSMLSGFFLD